MLLNILQCTRQPPTRENYLALKINIAEVVKSCFREILVFLGVCMQSWLGLELKIYPFSLSFLEF